MTPDERRMLEGLVTRVRSAAQGERDPEAQRFLEAELGREPHALYVLTQAVLILELALRSAEEKLAQASAAPRPPASFLGDGASGPWGRRPVSDSTTDLGAARYGEPPARRYGAPLMTPAAPAWGGPGALGAAPTGAWAAGGPGGGSFLRGAAQTAAGVAGGVLAAEALGSLLHGGGLGGMGGFGHAGQAPETVVNETIINEHGDQGAPPDTAPLDASWPADEPDMGGDAAGLVQTDDGIDADPAATDDTSWA